MGCRVLTHYERPLPQGVAHPTTAPGGVPYVFMCAPGGAGVAPLEYVDVDTEHYETALARLTGAPAFVAEYAAALEALALTDVVGLTILPPTHVCKARALRTPLVCASFCGRLYILRVRSLARRTRNDAALPTAGRVAAGVQQREG